MVVPERPARPVRPLWIGRVDGEKQRVCGTPPKHRLASVVFSDTSVVFSDTTTALPAVQKRLGLLGQLIVHHEVNVGDVEAASSNISGHEHAKLALTEAAEHLFTNLW